MGFYRVLNGFSGFYWVSVRFYRVVNGLKWVLLECTGIGWVLLSFSGFKVGLSGLLWV